ncbi:MAG: thioredoxin [Coxiellaceae bacterium]|nr:thioredoxin [Coxiellaceae bacterium]
MGNAITITDATFEEQVINSDTPVLVDFWAEWCGPCKMLSPVLEEIAGEYEGRLQIVKVNVDENASAASQYGVRSIPYLVLFKNGSVVATEVGAKTKSQLAAFLDQHV